MKSSFPAATRSTCSQQSSQVAALSGRRCGRSPAARVERLVTFRRIPPWRPIGKAHGCAPDCANPDQGFAISSPRGSAQPRRVNTYCTQPVRTSVPLPKSAQPVRTWFVVGSRLGGWRQRRRAAIGVTRVTARDRGTCRMSRRVMSETDETSE